MYRLVLLILIIIYIGELDGIPSIRYGGDVCPTWAQWQTLGFDTHIETTADPLFVSTTNFQLQTTSPAIGEGVEFRVEN